MANFCRDLRSQASARAGRLPHTPPGGSRLFRGSPAVGIQTDLCQPFRCEPASDPAGEPWSSGAAPDAWIGPVGGCRSLPRPRAAPEEGLDFLAGFMQKTAENDGMGISGSCPRKLLVLSRDMGENGWGPTLYKYLSLIRHIDISAKIESLGRLIRVYDPSLCPVGA